MEPIIQAEERLLTAMHTHDVHALELLLADELLFTDHLGRHITKAQDLAEHRSGRMTIEELTPSEQVVRELPDACVVSVRLRIKGTYEQQPFAGDIRYTRLWVVRDGRWQVLAGHSSVVVPAT